MRSEISGGEDFFKSGFLLEYLSTKTKRTRLNAIMEDSSAFKTDLPAASVTQTARRKSTRLSQKPYHRELPSSSSDEEVS